MGRRLVAAVALVCFGGCSSTATIVRTDGPDNESEIVSSDPAALYVRGRNGRTYRIGRESVSDIDHPGNVELLVGSILIGMAGLVVFASRDSSDNGSMAAVTLVYGGPGLWLFLSGLYHYVSSVQAAGAFESAEIPRTPPGTFVPASAWPPPPPPLISLPPTTTPPPPTETTPVPPPTSPAPAVPPGPEVVPNATSPP